MSNIKVDFSDLEEFRDKLKKVRQVQVDLFCERCAKELAARLLAKVIKKTPVAKTQYENEESNSYDEGEGAEEHEKGKQQRNKSGKNKAVKHVIRMGGTLRRGWMASKNAAVHRSGSNYVIEIMNPVEYASYVEYGHRTPDHKGWVPGQFFLTISEDEIKKITPMLLKQRLEIWLKEVVG